LRGESKGEIIDKNKTGDNMKKFDFIGKKRTLKRVKMAQLMDMQGDIQEAMINATNGNEQLLAMGRIVATFIEDFEPEEMLEAEMDDFYLAQGLPMIITYIKHKRSNSDIENLKGKIIDAAIDAQINNMGSGNIPDFR